MNRVTLTCDVMLTCEKASLMLIDQLQAILDDAVQALDTNK